MKVARGRWAGMIRSAVFALALGLGFILNTIEVLVNLAIHWLGRTEAEDRS